MKAMRLVGTRNCPLVQNTEQTGDGLKKEEETP